MISVPIDRIVPLTDARDNFSRLVADVESAKDGLYVLTKGGKPSIALVNIKFLEELMGSKPSSVEEKSSTPKIEPIKIESAPVINSFKPTSIPTPPPTPSKPVSYEPPKTFSKPTPEPSKTEATPAVASFDAKPSINPSWTGEKTKDPVASTSDNKPSSDLIDPPKPKTTSPWPIIPPRRDDVRDTNTATVPPRQNPSAEKGYESSTTVPPRPQIPTDSSSAPVQSPATVSSPTIPPAPAASINSGSSPFPSSVGSTPLSSVGTPTPPISTPAATAPVNTTTPPPYLPTRPFSPSATTPLVSSTPSTIQNPKPSITPPPPPPPPIAPSSTKPTNQEVPVPINGATSNPVPAAATLPPPPSVSTPAPFSTGSASSSAPTDAQTTPVTNTEEDSKINFDLPPTTISDPAEIKPDDVPATVKTEDDSETAAAPSSVKDLEI